ncbi:1-aminocyclopropane-1-carboxylate deaminase/D-cysteine desulfhydrase [Aquimarina sp. U1-2]|uniref:1-aminocyclopropane-1-carboxylate deaminase/D-cysteine desulfhydrase n=1 Tax=Aquimarina sp. U1-2 TaxID=2823141 RepID=UPI001AEC834E|nr:pyridoxal-phosphate dependent enzyme [Aquimarina sp. U1-2]MBP2831555.1 1-aminocyclopropane-1-carboxylate deaminase/D-cysteine desulfhydrase [Aquimarina sp. U1-2]
MHIFPSEVVHSQNQQISHTLLDQAEVFLDIKREDQLHPEVSGNKFRKLKYNVLEAKKLGYDTILTFGGAFSNHIAATAAAGKLLNLQTIGVIRGNELGEDLEKTLSQNDTLRFASTKGMRFKFVSREGYRDKSSPTFLESLKNEYGLFYPIAEGGTNTLAVQGCQEILTTQDHNYDIICCAVGTGGTIAGIINSSKDYQEVLGFPALKGDFLDATIKDYTTKTNWRLINEYHLGGYAKVNQELIQFINTFKKQQQIPLDPVYTGKMMFGIFDRIKNHVFPKNTRILAVHTGGLQGIAGMNKKLVKKRLPLITI